MHACVKQGLTQRVTDMGKITQNEHTGKGRKAKVANKYYLSLFTVDLPSLPVKFEGVGGQFCTVADRRRVVTSQVSGLVKESCWKSYVFEAASTRDPVVQTVRLQMTPLTWSDFMWEVC